MNLIEARRILDRHKEGTFYSPATINQALGLTGDLPEESEMACTPGQTKGVEGIRMGRCEET